MQCLCNIRLVCVPVFGSYGFSAFVLINKLYFNILEGTDIVYWFQYINTLCACAFIKHTKEIRTDIVKASNVS